MANDRKPILKQSLLVRSLQTSGDFVASGYFLDGSMVEHSGARSIGEKLTLQLLDHGLVSAQVRCVRNGRIGLSFATAAD